MAFTAADQARLDAAKAALAKRPLFKIKALQASTFGPQRDFVLDPASDKAALTTRRAGKSQSAATMLYVKALEIPNSIALYVALTRSSAKNILWPLLYEINDRFKLGATLQESTLNVVMPNGSRIILVGADMANFVERLRGAKYSIAIIDEAASFRSHLGMLISDVLKPALLDLNGPLVLLGTPGPIPSGTFFDITTKALGYSIHKWTLFDNPHLPRAREYVDDMIKKNQWTDKNPTYLREFQGLWIIDEDALVYKFSKDRNLYKTLPDNNTWVRVLAVDFGFNDQTAFTIATYSHTERKIFIEYSWGQSEMSITDIANKTKQLIAKFNPVTTVADCGALGKSIAEELIRRHQIPIKPAAKTDKLAWISLLNADYIDGNLFIHESLTNLQEQLYTLAKGDDGMEDPRLRNDLADSHLYAWRQCKSYLSQKPVLNPKEGQDGYGEFVAKKIMQEQEEEFKEEQSKEWWAQ